MTKHSLKQFIVLVTLVVATAGSACAHSYNVENNEFTDPLRVVALPVHAVGTVLENVILRPIHCFVSGPKTRRYFGHVTTPKDTFNVKDDDLQRSHW